MKVEANSFNVEGETGNKFLKHEDSGITFHYTLEIYSNTINGFLIVSNL